MPAKLLYTIVFCTMLFFRVNAQRQFVDKTFVAETGNTCKLMTDGGCTITTNCVLRFEAHTVSVYYITKASCTPKEREAMYEHLYDNQAKTYRWTLKNNRISIEGFKDYGPLIIGKNKLTGKIDGIQK